MLTLGIRKLAVILLVAGIVLAANIVFIGNWLDKNGLVDWAHWVRQEFLTGTAITVLAALLILLTGPRHRNTPNLIQRCDVCGRRSIGLAKYCAACGSRL